MVVFVFDKFFFGFFQDLFDHRVFTGFGISRYFTLDEYLDLSDSGKAFLLINLDAFAEQVLIFIILCTIKLVKVCLL